MTRGNTQYKTVNITYSSNCSYLTIFGCCSSFREEISLIAVEGTPSSSLSKRIFFIATILLVFLLRPLYTMPYVPEIRYVNSKISIIKVEIIGNKQKIMIKQTPDQQYTLIIALLIFLLLKL